MSVFDPNVFSATSLDASRVNSLDLAADHRRRNDRSRTTERCVL
ncbi:hypothetical protein N9338_03315 [Luminiphilus sp.]|nr:hypothetical protein [Luminiphilus sp.]MDB2380594.1 hypothetical protein [Luminiphilus sp.]MDB2441468.1 hypothetical protein [Luminiphilus sp.]MDB2512029.1 hypothetical protein [Luminiphilus sp.]MDB2654818.1 hypothetical protein [Luminiphilus sp.]